MGPSRYRGRCRRAIPNSDAESYAITNSFAPSMRTGNCNTYTHGHCYGYCCVYPDSNAYSNPHADGYTYRGWYSDADGDGHPDLRRPRHLATGADPTSGPLCPPGRPRHGQHALHRWWWERRQHDLLQPGLAL